MSTSIQCVHCSKIIPISKKLAGRKGKCPGCKEISRIPADLTVFNPLSDAPRSMSCPVCHEEIPSGSIQCDYCNENFFVVIDGQKSLELENEKPETLPSETENDADSQLRNGDILIATLSGTVSVILGVIWMFQRKRKGKKMLALSVFLNVTAVMIAFGFWTAYSVLSSH